MQQHFFFSVLFILFQLIFRFPIGQKAYSIICLQCNDSLDATYCIMTILCHFHYVFLMCWYGLPFAIYILYWDCWLSFSRILHGIWNVICEILIVDIFFSLSLLNPIPSSRIINKSQRKQSLILSFSSVGKIKKKTLVAIREYIKMQIKLYFQ